MLRTALAIVLLITLVSCTGNVPLPAGSSAPRDTSAFIVSQLNELGTLPCPAGVKPQTWDDLRAALRKVLEARLADLQAHPRAVSSAPTSTGAATSLTWDISTPALQWRYYNPGDYNQDGEVNISDLTPLAAHLNQAPPDNTTDSVLSVIDGDSNGLVNISDITPLGANLGHRVTGYEFFDSTNFDDSTFDNSPSTIAPSTSVPFANAVGAPNQIRLQFQVPGTAEGLHFYWVRPLDGTDSSEGPVSNYVLGGGSHPDAVFSATAITGDTPLIDGFNGTASTGVGTLTFFWDLKGDGVFENNGTDATVSHNFTSSGVFNVSLRVLDSVTNYTDSSTLTVSVGSHAPTWRRYALPAPAGWDVKCISLGDYAGMPWYWLGVNDLDAGFNRIQYFTAGTPSGSAWSEPLMGTGGISSFDDRTDNMLAAGLPAVAWGKTEFGAVYFAPGPAPFGSYLGSWDQGNAVATVPTEISSFSVANIDGAPAQAFFDPSGSGLVYESTSDSTGQSGWGAGPYPLGGPSGTIGAGASLASVSSAPAIAFIDPNLHGIYYVDSIIVSHTVIWNPPVFVANANSALMFDGLYVLPNGVPAVVYHDLFAQEVVQVTAQNSSGDMWGVPQVLATTSGEVRLLPRAIVAGGAAHIFYDSISTGELMHCESTSAPWDTYSAPEIVATGVDASVLINVADLGGYPGVAYVSSTGEPRMAIQY